MTKAEQRAVFRIVIAATEAENPTPDQAVIVEIFQQLPKRWRDLVRDRYINRIDWLALEDKYYYSERQMRYHLRDAALAIKHRVEQAVLDGRITGDVFMDPPERKQ